MENQSSLFDDIPFTQYTEENHTDVGEESDLPECNCDHSKNETCSVCVRVQSPEVYRLDFTDEADHSGDQDTLESGSVSGHREKGLKPSCHDGKDVDENQHDKSVVEDTKVSDYNDISESSGRQENQNDESDAEKFHVNSVGVKDITHMDNQSDSGILVEKSEIDVKQNRSRSPTAARNDNDPPKDSSQNANVDKRKPLFSSKPDRLVM